MCFGPLESFSKELASKSCLVLNSETQFESHQLSNLSCDSFLDFQ